MENRKSYYKPVTVQDYAMQILTEDELEDFLIEEDMHGRSLIFSRRGVYELFFDINFHYYFYASEHLKPLTVTQKGIGYTVNLETVGGKQFRLLFLQQREAHRKADALLFLYAY